MLALKFFSINSNVRTKQWEIHRIDNSFDGWLSVYLTGAFFSGPQISLEKTSDKGVLWQIHADTN